MRPTTLAALLLAFVAPAFAKTHHDTFNVPCNVLWAAVKDTLRNSGKYGIIGIDNTEMTASYNMGGNLTGKRINSVVLNKNGIDCDLQVQTAFSGLANNDAGDLVKRVHESLQKIQAEGGDKPAAGEAKADSAAAAGPSKPTGSALTNGDIIALKNAGLSEQLIIEKIRSSPSKYSLETSDLVALKGAGIPDGVISAMLEARNAHNQNSIAVPTLHPNRSEDTLS